MKGEIMDKKNKAVDVLKKTKQKVVKTLDQDNDNKLSIKDASIFATNIEGSAKKARKNIKKNIDKKNFIKQKRELQPISNKDLSSPDFKLSKMIRITEIDKKRANSVACKGSVGYYSNLGQTKLVNIYFENADLLGVSFYPDKTHEIYYIDPVDKNKYIASDVYFNYLKDIRVNELQKIAQDLGATHFKVTYKGYNSASSNKDIKGKAKVTKVSAEVEHESGKTDVFVVDIAAEAKFPAHDPVAPKLKYLKKEPCIQTLIAMRMDSTGPIEHQKYTLNLSNTSGISAKDAIKLDSKLKELKASGNVSFTSIVNNEAKSVFEYEVDFQ